MVNLCLETDFLPSLQLYDPAIVNHQLDRTEPYSAKRVPQGLQDRGG